MKIFLYCLALCFSPLFAAEGAGGSSSPFERAFDDGTALFFQARYSDAVPYLEQCAKEDQSVCESKAVSQFLLGMMYYRGLGVERNFSNARQRFKQARISEESASLKKRPALLLSKIWEEIVRAEGHGDEHNLSYEKFCDHFESTVKAKSAVNFFGLGALYKDLVDFNKSIFFYTKSYEEKTAARDVRGEAAYEIALIYMQGLCVPKNPGLAIEWLENAAVLECPQALCALSMMSHK